MSAPDPSVPEITRQLKAWAGGDRAALDHLMPKIYSELRRIAFNHTRRERPDQTLQATALVNEAYLQLIDVKGVDWKGRAHFFAVASQIMRRLLVDAARSRATAKRGGGVRVFNESMTVDFNAIPDTSASRDRELIVLDDALERLGQMDERKLKVVEMRFFGGMSAEETAEILSVSQQTVLRDWKLAKSWLSREISRSSAQLD